MLESKIIKLLIVETADEAVVMLAYSPLQSIIDHISAMHQNKDFALLSRKV